MRWHGKDGGYEAGPWRVERGEAKKWWVARGPGIEGGVSRHETKADAQSECEDAALLRIEGQGMTVEPVVGDIAVPLSSRRSNPMARVTSRIANSQPEGEPLYCLRFNSGGGRECLFRREFEVVLP
jgi:hypothetical protein